VPEEQDDQGEDFVDEETVGGWLDLPREDSAREPPPGDLPDLPPPSAAGSQPGVWNRIVRLIRGR
jgi:hypothetical protein